MRCRGELRELPADGHPTALLQVIRSSRAGCRLALIPNRSTCSPSASVRYEYAFTDGCSMTRSVTPVARCELGQQPRSGARSTRAAGSQAG
jgi:hypothetical protein